VFNTILLVTANYLLVQACIILFMAPFYYFYWRTHVKGGEVKVDLNRHLELFFSSKYANWLIFFWAMGEALIWFVIPEFLLILLIFMRVKRKRELLFYDIYGTATGTLIAFVVHIPERFVDKLPYIQPAMVGQVKQWFNTQGIFGLIHQPFSGVPYKVFTHLAPHYHFFFLAFLVFAILVRISRYYFAYVLLSSIYPILHKYVYRNYIKLFLIATFIFSILLLEVYSEFGPNYHISFDQQKNNIVGQR
jgi:membrane protein YqaA with SNARE-associated domain